MLAPTAHAKFASLVIDAETGKILHAVNADTRNYPASLTKMMTLYKIFERIEQGRWSLATKIKISRRAARQPASKLGLRRGQTITARQAILALITKSANDVATAVAEAIAGSERDFALQMTATARKLGMRRTTFRNASGLPHRGQMSTARDMGRLALALLRDYPQYYHYFKRQRFAYGGASHRNHNKLLGKYTGADGFKTGYIRASGFNLVASAKRDGRRIIGVIFGGRSSKMRNRLMVKLLDKGFRLTRPAGAPALIAQANHKPPQAVATPAKRVAQASTKSTTARSRQGWGIQVGAFARRTQALRAANKVAGRLPHLMDDGRVRIVPLKKRSGRILYRARIYGITKREAYRACKVLKDCLEVRTNEPLEVAQATN